MSGLEARQISAEHYATFVAEVPHSHFHELPWLEVIAQVYGVEIVPLGFYQGDSLIAVSPMMKRRIGLATLCGAPLRKCAVPAATPFCAPLDKAGQVLTALQNWAKQRNVGFLQATVPDWVDTRDVAPDRIEELDNLELSLAPPVSSIWQRLSQSPRYEVRKAVRAGVRVHWCHGMAVLGELSGMLRDTYCRQGAGTKSNYSELLYEELLKNREASGLKVLCAKYQGQMVAALWIFADAERCYYWDALSRESGRRLSANHLLVWCLIRWSHRRGYRVLDFVGTSTGGRGGARPGIGRFKQSMGAVPTYHNICYWYSPWYGLLLRVYRSTQVITKKLKERLRNA